jgi:hypothetical protein
LNRTSIRIAFVIVILAVAVTIVIGDLRRRVDEQEQHQDEIKRVRRLRTSHRRVEHERIFPAGSLNQAIVGSFPRMIPFFYFSLSTSYFVFPALPTFYFLISSAGSGLRLDQLATVEPPCDLRG